MVVLMTRHGQTDWNVERKVQGKADIELNEKGIEQAKITSEKLKDEKIDIIISSPLKRAKQTAEIINEKLNCPIIYEEGISERDFGEFEGKRRDEFDFEGFWSYKKNFKYDKAENIREFFNRIYSTLDNIKEKYKDKNVLIVSHGGVSIPVNCYFNGIPDKENLLFLGLHNCEVVKYYNR
ncbi:MAG: histidine phosphatase family protein [Clostridia bacterium]|nr:histidine phosphatase family protein [Clostridia bacterium]